jgi:hypothetical protein
MRVVQQLTFTFRGRAYTAKDGFARGQAVDITDYQVLLRFIVKSTIGQETGSRILQPGPFFILY